MRCAIVWCRSWAKPIRFSWSMHRAARPPGSILDPTQTFASAASGRRPPNGPWDRVIRFQPLELFELRPVTPPAVMIDLRVQQQHRDVLFRNAAHGSAGDSDDERIVREFLPFRDQRMRADNAIPADLCAIQYGRAHAD